MDTIVSIDTSCIRHFRPSFTCQSRPSETFIYRSGPYRSYQDALSPKETAVELGAQKQTKNVGQILTEAANASPFQK